MENLNEEISFLVKEISKNNFNLENLFSKLNESRKIFDSYYNDLVTSCVENANIIDENQIELDIINDTELEKTLINDKNFINKIILDIDKFYEENKKNLILDSIFENLINIELEIREFYYSNDNELILHDAKEREDFFKKLYILIEKYNHLYNDIYNYNDLYNRLIVFIKEKVIEINKSKKFYISKSDLERFKGSVIKLNDIKKNKYSVYSIPGKEYTHIDSIFKDIIIDLTKLAEINISFEVAEDEEGEYSNFDSERENREINAQFFSEVFFKLGLEKEFGIKLINELLANGKYPVDKYDLANWNFDILREIKKVYSLQRFTPQQIYEICHLNFYTINNLFKKDKFLLEKINKFYRSSLVESFESDFDKEFKIDFKINKKISEIIDLFNRENYKGTSILRKYFYNEDRNDFYYLANINFFNNCRNGLILDLITNGILSIDYGKLKSGYFLQFSSINNIQLNNVFFKILIEILLKNNIKDENRIISLAHRAKEVTRILHNNDYYTDDASMSTNYEYNFNLLQALLLSKWDLNQDLVDKFLNLSLNTKIDTIFSDQETSEKSKKILEFLNINYDNFRNSIMELRQILASGKDLPFSWKEKIYKLDNDVEAILNSDVILQVQNKIEKKDDNLFKLNYYLDNGLRFEVLPDKSIKHFTVGADTQCCQRVGGAGESACIDSYINGFAGVLVLYYNNKVISQSYFHYVPEDNGFILDNIESNDKMIRDLSLNLNNIYAVLGKKIKQDHNINYFRCGKGYNKLNNNMFKSSSLKDKRRFVWDEEEDGEPDVYSDFDEEDHIDLLEPTFPVLPINMTPYTKKARAIWNALIKYV